MAHKHRAGLKFFISGYCKSHYRMVNPGGKRGRVKFHAPWCLLDIPGTGYVMFDTGYSEHFNEATRGFPGRLYRWITPVTLLMGESAVEILRKMGIGADEVKYIIISHFHADHIAGLRDFPTAKLICSAASLDELNSLNGLRALKRGILSHLVPGDFNERLTVIEDFADSISVSPEGFITYNIFGLSNFSLVSLPGHSTGMLGFIFNGDERDILYASDAAWDSETYRDDIMPSKTARILFPSWEDYLLTRSRIKAYERNNSSCLVLFSHCPETLEYAANEV